jgi:hypothetical protein
MKRSGKAIPEALPFERLRGPAAAAVDGQTAADSKLYALDDRPGVFRRVARKSRAVATLAGPKNILAVLHGAGADGVPEAALIELVPDAAADAELRQAGYVQQSGPRYGPQAGLKHLVDGLRGPEVPHDDSAAPGVDPVPSGAHDPDAEEAFMGITGGRAIVPGYLEQRADDARRQIAAEDGVDPVVPDPNPNADPLPEPPPETGEPPPDPDAAQGELTMAEILKQQEARGGDTHAEPQPPEPVPAETPRRGRNRRAEAGHAAR